MALEQVPFDAGNLILFVVLILLFIVAYRLLQAVIRTGIVAVLSGVFLVALDKLGVGPLATPNRIILFMVLGTALFITFSLIDTLWRTSTLFAGRLSRLIRWALRPMKRHRRKRKNRPAKQDSKEKMIVLGEMEDE